MRQQRHANHGATGSLWGILFLAGFLVIGTVDSAGQETPPRESGADAAAKEDRDQDAADSSDAKPPRQPSADDVLRALQRDLDPRRPVIPRDSTPGVRSTFPTDSAPDSSTTRRSGPLLPEGYRLVDRPGRLASGSGWEWMFVFEERGTGDVEQPIRLLPNLLLEQMEIISEGGRESVVFLVSGDVTEYRGENYLLVQKLLVRPNLGNFR